MNLFVDTTAGQLVISPTNPLRCLPPELTVGDKVPLTLAFLQRNPQPLNTGVPVYNYLDFSESNVVLSLGPVSTLPTAGTFSLQFGANATAALPWNVSQYALAAALNALASIVSAGGVSVVGDVGGPFQISFLTNGSQDLFTAPLNALFPTCAVMIATANTGTSSNPAIQNIAIAQTPAVQITSWTPQSDAAITVTSLSADVIQRVWIPAGTYGGTFTLTYNGNTTTAIPFNAQMDVVAAALNALSGITGATVWPGQNYWDITIPGGSHALTGNAAGLMIPLTLSAVLDLSSQAVLNLLNGRSETPIPFTIQASPDSDSQTFFAGYF